MPAAGKDHPQEETVVYGPLGFVLALLRKALNRREAPTP
jgi:hypothetical protein